MGVLLGSIGLSWSPWGLCRDQWRLVRLNGGSVGELELNGHQFIGVQWGYLWLRKSHYGAEGLNVGHWTSV